MMLQETWARSLVQARTRRGHTWRSMSAETGITVANQSNWTTNTHSPSLRSIDRAAKALSLSPAEMVTGIPTASRQPLKEVFPALLSAARKDRGWSKAELSMRAQIDKKQIARLEHGSQTPTLRTVERLAAALGIPPECLLRREEVPT